MRPTYYELAFDNTTIDLVNPTLDELVSAFETTAARLREARDAGLELERPSHLDTFRFVTTDPELAVLFGMTECHDLLIWFKSDDEDVGAVEGAAP
jgi:hypothetical protein